jgi:enoyl-CoA hydratase/carnithine racemase
MAAVNVEDHGSFVQIDLPASSDAATNTRMLGALQRAVSGLRHAPILFTATDGDYRWDVAPGQQTRQLRVEVLCAVRMHPARTLAAVEGSARGFGLHLALAADRIIASTSATFEIGDSLPPPDSEAVQRILALMGPVGARELFLLNSSIDAQRMLALHAVAAVVPPESLIEVARTMAKEAGRGHWKMLPS